MAALADRLDRKERNVLGQVLKHAVGGLIGIDSEAGANHGLPDMRECSTPGRCAATSARFFGVSRLLFQPTLAAETIGIGLSAASALADGWQSSPDCRRPQTPDRPGREIDVGGLVRLRDQVLVELVAQTRDRVSDAGVTCQPSCT